MKARIGRLLLETARYLARLGYQLHGLDMSGSYVSLLPLERPEVFERRMRERLREAEKLANALDERYEREAALRRGDTSGVNWKLN